MAPVIALAATQVCNTLWKVYEGPPWHLSQQEAPHS